MKNLFIAICLPLLIVACSTTTKVTIPSGAKLYVNDAQEPVAVRDGEVTTRPFFWSAIAGIPFRLEQDEKTIKQGKLQARFRPASIFWPPYAIIYWPVGFARDEYDLTKDTPTNDSE